MMIEKTTDNDNILKTWRLNWLGTPIINLEIVMISVNVEDAVCGGCYLHSSNRNWIFNTDRK
jgi:hypothetical protein